MTAPHSPVGPTPDLRSYSERVKAFGGASPPEPALTGWPRLRGALRRSGPGVRWREPLR